VVLVIPGLLLEPDISVTSATGVISALLEVTVLVLVYRPAANRYFAGRRP
jgi:hypothetical protein